MVKAKRKMTSKPHEAKSTMAVLMRPKWAILFWLTSVLMTPVTATPVPVNSSGENDALRTCKSDADCGVGYFCFTKYEPNYCAKCLDCGEFRRQANTWQSCVQSVSSCGDCLPGYVRVGRHCQFPEPSPEPNVIQSSNPSISGASVGVTAGLAVLGLSLGIVGTTLLFKLRARNPAQMSSDAKAEDGQSNAEVEPLAGPSAPCLHESPPPYNTSHTFVPYRSLESTTSSAHNNVLSYGRVVGERLQQALPYATGRAAGPRAEAFLGGNPPDGDNGGQMETVDSSMMRQVQDMLMNREDLNAAGSEQGLISPVENLSEESMDLGQPRAEPEGDLADSEDDEFMDLDSELLTVDIDVRQRLRIPVPVRSPSNSDDNDDDAKVPVAATPPPNDQ